MALICCPECSKSISEAASACPHCGFKLTAEVVAAQKQKEQGAEAAAVGCVFVFGAIAVVLLLLCSGVFSSSSSSSSTPTVVVPVSRYEDPRDARFDNPAGREVIRAFAEEAGVSQQEMKRALNNEIDRRGLSDWADSR